LIRVVRNTDGILVDRKQLLPGRGAYVHAASGCIEKAVRKGGLARALKMKMTSAVPGEAVASLVDALKSTIGDWQGSR